MLMESTSINSCNVRKGQTQFLSSLQVENRKSSPSENYKPGKTDRLYAKRAEIKILVADVNLLFQELIETFCNDLLDACTIRFITAYNGQSGLTKIYQYQPEIIIFNPKLPLKNGITMIQELQRSSLWHQGYFPHLIALSAYQDQDINRQVLQLGVQHCYTKAFNTQTLVQHLRSIVANLHS
ncbi:MAG TPA: response regulator [Chloroflexia bacterium]|nr:response regulator [Chloroflexia bacterium]